jgi:hypothetical protein
VRLESLTAVFKNTDNITACCRRFVGASVTLYQTERNMILDDVSGRTRGEQRDDDDDNDIRITSREVTHYKLFRTYPSVFCVTPGSREI